MDRDCEFGSGWLSVKSDEVKNGTTNLSGETPRVTEFSPEFIFHRAGHKGNMVFCVVQPISSVRVRSINLKESRARIV